MTVKGSLSNLANTILRPLGAELVRYRRAEEEPWDPIFLKWLAAATPSGKDPNDIGDSDWRDDPLPIALRDHYLPHITPDATVLELGPGTGRLTRHIISRCRQMILLDRSQLACKFLESYLRGKGRYQIHRVNGPLLTMVGNATAEVVFANGVFEHLDPEESLWSLREFYRVLKPGGVAVFNFCSLETESGMACLRENSGRPGVRCAFRFYHPQMMTAIGLEAGLVQLRVCQEHGRLVYVEFRRPLA